VGTYLVSVERFLVRLKIRLFILGILKPMSGREITGPRYRARQNVAMAAILRANQVVTFF
jgi:hypothetical protein